MAGIWREYGKYIDINRIFCYNNIRAFLCVVDVLISNIHQTGKKRGKMGYKEQRQEKKDFANLLRRIAPKGSCARSLKDDEIIAIKRSVGSYEQFCHELLVERFSRDWLVSRAEARRRVKEAEIAWNLFQPVLVLRGISRETFLFYSLHTQAVRVEDLTGGLRLA